MNISHVRAVLSAQDLKCTTGIFPFPRPHDLVQPIAVNPLFFKAARPFLVQLKTSATAPSRAVILAHQLIPPSSPKKEEVCFGPPAFAGNYRHLPAIAGFCRRLPAYAGICRKVPEKSRRTIKMSLSGRLSPSPGLTPTSGLTPFGRRERTGLLSAYSVVRFPPSFGNIFYPFTNYDF